MTTKEQYGYYLSGLDEQTKANAVKCLEQLNEFFQVAGETVNPWAKSLAIPAVVRVIRVLCGVSSENIYHLNYHTDLRKEILNELDPLNFFHYLEGVCTNFEPTLSLLAYIDLEVQLVRLFVINYIMMKLENKKRALVAQ